MTLGTILLIILVLLLLGVIPSWPQSGMGLRSQRASRVGAGGGCSPSATGPDLKSTQSDKAVWLLIGGSVAAIVGLFGFFVVQ